MKLCRTCLGDKQFTYLFSQEKIKHLCQLCRKQRKCINQNIFFREMLKLITNNFIPLDELKDWNRCLIVECGSNKYFTTMIRELLGESAIHEKVQDAFFKWLIKKDESHFSKDIIVFNEGDFETHNEFLCTWKNLTDEIKYSKRFFNYHALAFFDKLFSFLDLEEKIISIDKNCTLYRARKLIDLDELKKIKKNPANEMGTVPHDLATDQRMTPFGISSFYGAFERDTCISEVRPIVGGYLVTAAFKPIMELKLIDCTSIKFEKNYDYWDEKSSLYNQAINCFSTMIDEISKPSISKKNFDYLPSQIFFEYMREKYSNLAVGVKFPSIQTNKRGKNIILFPEKSRICSEGAELRNKCLEHAFYEEHIEYIENSLEVHQVDNITVEYKTYSKDEQFLFNEILRNKSFK